MRAANEASRAPDRVQQPDRGGAHRRQVVDVDQHRAPAGPLAGRAPPSTGRSRRTRRPGRCRAPARRRRRRTRPPARAAGDAAAGQQTAERALGRGGQPGEPADRPPHQHVRAPGHAGGPDRLPAQPAEEPFLGRPGRWRRTAAPRPARRARRPPGPGPRPPARAAPPGRPPAGRRTTSRRPGRDRPGRAGPRRSPRRPVPAPPAPRCAGRRRGRRCRWPRTGSARPRTPGCAAPGRPPVRPGRRPARSGTPVARQPARSRARDAPR